jgi:LacI family transcriptional regulator
MGSKQQISIKDISREAGVSTATVSRVINNKGKYSPETRDRVLEVIERNSYVPNMTAKALRVSRQQTIGVILPEVVNEFFATITLDMQRLLFDLGYSTIICNTSYSVAYAKRYSAMLKSQNVSGVICVYDRQMDIADYPEDLPIVFVGYMPAMRAERGNIASIQIDFMEAGRMVTNALIERGCRRIVHLSNWLNTREGISQRFEGFKRSMEENGLTIDPRLLVEVESTGASSAYRAVMNLLESGVSFDGVACNSDQSATGVIHALKERGLRVPEDVRVIGFDNMRISKYFIPSISSVEMKADLHAKLAVDCMMALVKGEALDQTSFILSAEIVQRETT